MKVMLRCIFSRGEHESRRENASDALRRSNNAYKL